MKQLTTHFIEKQGFRRVDLIREDLFYYEEWQSSLYPSIVIFVNYYNTGLITTEVLLNKFELKNVGKKELLMLFKITLVI